jgi:protein-S-isoprenylcysteine O-methyltransferase Ste14
LSQQTTKSWAFVIFQVILLILIVFGPNFWNVRSSNYITSILALLLSLIGILIVFRATLDIKKVMSVFPVPKSPGGASYKGLYSYVRHPMYSGVLLFCLGVIVLDLSLFKLFLLAILFILFYFKSNYEETLLVEVNPDYSKYKNKTPRFIPRFRR